MAEEGAVRRAALSLSEKREIMWNFTEPGDPYDIRKSMIAKLPGEQKFMGPHLELVCLLQAAEIERLCQCLEEFKMRFRQNERVELDRHSYEVQIRELTERLAEEQNYTAEIQKLREFIRRQSIELEELQTVKNVGELQRNYEESLRQIAEIKLVNARLVGELRLAKQQWLAGEDQRSRQAQTQRMEIQRKNAAFAQLQSKSKQNLNLWQGERRQYEQRLAASALEGRQLHEKVYEIQDGNRHLQRQIERLTLEATKSQQLTHTIGEYENRFQILAQEIDRLNGVLRQKSRQLNEEYARGRQLAELNRRQGQQLAQSQAKIRQIQQNNAQLQRQHRQNLISLSTLQQTKSLTQSYETSLQKLSIEVDRLNTVLRKKLNQLEESRRKNNEAEIRLKTLESLQKENSDYKLRYAQVNKRMSEYERQSASGRQENERLNYSIKKLIEQLNALELRLKNAEKEIDNRQRTIQILNAQIGKERQTRVPIIKQLTTLQGDNASLREAASRYEDSKRIYQTKLTQYVGQVKRLHQTLEGKEQEVSLVRSSKSETELRMRVVQSINQNDQMYIQELLGTNQELQDQVQRLLLQKEKIEGQLKTKQQERGILDQGQLISQQYQQISRLNDILTARDTEIHRLTDIIEQLRRVPTSQPLPQDVQRLQGLIRQRDGQFQQLQQHTKSIQIALIQKEQVMHYYMTDNERYHAENQGLKSTLEQRQGRIQRLEVEMDKISRIVGETTIKLQGEEEISKVEMRGQVEHGILKEKFNLLNEENETTLKKMHELQEEIIRLNYRLTHPRPLPSDTPPKREQQQALTTSISQGRGGLEQEREQILIELHYLRNHCIFLAEEAQRWRVTVLQREQELGKLHQQLQITQKTLSDQRNKPWRQRQPPSKEASQIQQAYSQLVQRYNALFTENEHWKQQARNLAERVSSISAVQGVEMQKKNEQIAQYYNKILLFSQEIERLNNVMSQKEREKQVLVNDFKTISENYEAKIRLISTQTRSGEEKQQNIEQNQRLLLLSNQLEQKLREFEARSQQQQRILQDKIELLQKEIIRLNQILQVKVDECGNLAAKNSSLSQQLQEQRRKGRPSQGTRLGKGQYEAKMAILGEQIQRLNGVLKLKVENYQILQQEYHRYQEDAFKRINDQAKEYHQAQSQLFRLNSIIQQLKGIEQHKNIQIESLSQYQEKILEQSTEIERLSRLLLASRQKIEELQGRQERYRSQIQRLNNSLRLKVEESMLYENKERELQNERHAHSSQLEIKIKQYESLSVRYRQLQQQAEMNRQHLVEYQKRIKELYEQFQRLKKIITALRKDTEQKGTNINDLIQKNRFLGGQLERITKINKKHSEDLEGLRLSVAEDSSLQRRINEDLGLFVVLFAEIQSLRERVRQQQIELEEVRGQNIAARLV